MELCAHNTILTMSLCPACCHGPVTVGSPKIHVCANLQREERRQSDISHRDVTKKARGAVTHENPVWQAIRSASSACLSAYPPSACTPSVLVASAGSAKCHAQLFDTNVSHIIFFMPNSRLTCSEIMKTHATACNKLQDHALAGKKLQKTQRKNPFSAASCMRLCCRMTPLRWHLPPF